MFIFITFSISRFAYPGSMALCLARASLVIPTSFKDKLETDPLLKIWVLVRFNESSKLGLP